MIDSRSARILALTLLAAFLIAHLALTGTIEPNPERNRYPNENDFAGDYETYVGHEIEFGGTVVATDPVIVETHPYGSEPIRLELRNLDAAVEEGMFANVYGIARNDGVVEVRGSWTREPWEATYMYAVSFIAGVWTLARFLRQWTFDLRTLSFSPVASAPEGREGDRRGERDA